MTTRNSVSIFKIAGSLLAFVLISTILFSGVCYGTSDNHAERSDIIVIQYMKMFGDLKRPPVMFFHDEHTDYISTKGQDCTACHTQKDGRLSKDFVKMTGMSKEAVMNAYHEKCLNCHNQVRDAGEKKPPVTCGSCHVINPKTSSAWKAVNFDNSLHYRHIKAADNKCETCHHEVTDAGKKRGTVESACRACHTGNTSCHKIKSKDGSSSFSMVAHSACISCHMENKKGPSKCSACHSEAAQNKIKVVHDIPRLKRNQPDSLIVSVPKNSGRLKMPSVNFNHKMHEKANDSCYVCHHETIKKCSDCHSITGDKSAEGVTLSNCMHMGNSDHSCIGCHNRRANQGQCAGCHVFVGKKPFSDYKCSLCHSVKPDQQTVINDVNDVNDVNGVNNSNDIIVADKDKQDSKAEKASPFSVKFIPETVVIKTIANAYEPVKFPHRAIIDAMYKMTKDNKLASHFHSTPDTLCMGCHHNTPAGIEPPKCSSCHSKPLESDGIFRPGMKGAYHIQCINCHKKLKIKNPNGCTDCHQDYK